MAAGHIDLPGSQNLPSQTWTQDAVTVDGQQVVVCDSAGNVVGVTSNRLDVNDPGTSTATRSQVSDTVSDTLLLAANSARIGAAIANDSSGVLIVGLGTTTVTSTNYTVRLGQHVYYEVPRGFVGQIRGLWLTDPNDGAARVTEF